MKVFIVFLGLLIINMGFLAYQGDMGRYIRCQNYLKALAEECAAGAALYRDEESYSEGQFRFQYEEGQEYIDYILEESMNNMPLPKNSDFDCKVVFQDDNLGYENQTGSTSGGEPQEAEIPSVTVVLTAKTGDLFRLPFLEVTEIRRAAKYELPQ